MSASADLVVVGAGFAGLACAEAAARAGQRVILLERKRWPVAGAHTTGLLARDALAAVRPPPGTLGPRLDGIEIVAGARWTSGIRLRREGAGFTPTRTVALLGALTERAAAAGAAIRHGQRVEGVELAARGPVVVAGAERVRAARVIACDGASSAIAAALGLPPQRVLVGVERHLDVPPGGEGSVEPDACLLAFDGRLAPGYAAWAFRGAESAWQVGVLGIPVPGFRPAAALDAFLARLARERGFLPARVRHVLGGVVPVGGPRRSPVAGIVLAGDAAGHVSALTAGGIGRAALAGRLAAASAEDGAGWRAIESSCGGWRRRARVALEILGGSPVAPLAALPGMRAALEHLLFRPTRELARRGATAARSSA